MAKLPKLGVTYRSLCEKDCTLAEVMKSLGLKPLTKKAETNIRERLGFALGKWDAPYPPFVVRDVVRLLNSRAKCLDEVGKLGTIAHAGFSREGEIVVGANLVRVLAFNAEIGSVQGAHAYLRDFCDKAHTLSSACRLAARNLQSRKGKGGKPRLDWYDDFTAVLVQICENNGIEPKVGIDDVSGAAIGRLGKLAFAFERLLPPEMRSRTATVMVKRLQRSLRRLREQSPSIAA